MALISNIPSSSSSSSNSSKFKNDVFISFRGEDTRRNLICHLHKALCQNQIETFIDYKLNRGDEISPSLLQAIEESKISVIIFSKDYASSRWCLEELVKILECQKSYGQIVIPVFYNVVPTDVRNQTGTFGDAFTKYDQRQNLNKVQRWKDALKEAANLSEWHSSTIKDECVLIKNIVEDIFKRLNAMSSSDSNGLVGIDKKIEQIVSWLEKEDVRSLGILGIGGIGKTTLAVAVYDRISSQFKGSSFIQNIRERSEQSGGLNHMRRELLSTVLKDENVTIGTAIVGVTFIRNRLVHKKLLIVFDDVTDFRQIETLIGGFGCLNSQCRIIITTRDRQVLRNCGVDQVYEVQELFHHEALELFCRYAFKKNHPSEDYMVLSKRVCEYARGVPLALKVMGSSMYGRRKQEWVSALRKLERITGGEIVRQECTVEPGKWSRLWNYDDIYHVLTKNKMEYLKPVNFYKEIFKDILIKRDYLKPGRLLGLDVSDKYVSLAVSDWKNLTAVPLRALDRQEINMSLMVDMIQSFISEHNLVGFVFTSKYSRPMDEQTEIFIDDLCKTRNFEGLKYTVWECGTTSKNAEFVFKQHLKFIIENLPLPLSNTIMGKPQPQLQPQDMSKTIMGKCQPQPQPWAQAPDMSKTIMEKCYAVSTLQPQLQPQDMSKTIMGKCQPQPQPQPWAQAPDVSKTIMEKCYAVSTLQGYLDATNKMVKEDWD